MDDDEVKTLGCVVLVIAAVVAVVAGFFALVAWSIVRGDDMSALTERIDLEVVDPVEDTRSRGRGYAFDYAYERDGRWYGGEYWFRDNDFEPGQRLTACIDPDRPSNHVITLRGQPCGRERIYGNFIQEATPRPAP